MQMFSDILDYQKVWKAIAAGVSAAVTGEGVAVIGGGPDWLYAVVPVVNFIIGFVITYRAPKNK